MDPEHTKPLRRLKHQQRMTQLKSTSIANDTTLELSLDEIETYVANPRLYANPKYLEIKESIRRIGVQHRIIVTRRPKQEKYVIRQGGNTRLQCLRELYEETGEARFAKAPCIYKNWTEEIDLLLGHMVENDHRGNLNWHERAHMTCALKKVLEQNQNRKLSSRQFQELAAGHGITVYRERLHLQLYTLKRLAGPFAAALAKGMGRTKVLQLYRSEQALRKLWNEASFAEEEFEAMIGEQFMKMEGTFDAYQLFEKFGQIFYSHTNDFCIDEFSRRLIDYSSGHGRDMPAFEDFLYRSPSAGSFDESYEVGDSETDGMDESSEQDDELHDAGQNDTSAEAEQPQAPLHPSVVRRRVIEARSKIHHCAELVANWASCGECVRQVSYGYGYLVTHLPQPLQKWQLEMQPERDQAWWLLLELSQTHAAIHSKRNTMLLARAHNSDLLPFFQSGKMDDLLKVSQAAGVKTPSPLDTAREMLTTPEKFLYRNWQHMLNDYRRLSHLVDREKYDIWKEEE